MDEDKDGDLLVGIDPETGDVLLQAPCGSVTTLDLVATTDLIDALTDALRHAVSIRSAVSNRSIFLS